MTARRLAVALLLVASTAAAQVTVDAELQCFAYPRSATARDPDVTRWPRVDLEWKSRLGDRARTPWLVVSARAEAVNSGERGPLVFDPADREPRRSPLALGDFYLRAPLRRGVDVQLGRFRLGWGKTDGYSPADAFLPRDLSDAFAEEKLPIWGARLYGQRGLTRFDIVAAVVTTPWRLPLLDGRFAPLDVGDAVRGAGLAPVDVFLVDARSDVPTFGFAAARVQHQFGELELGAWVRGGNRPAPHLVIRPQAAYPVPEGIAIPADRRHAREQGFGFEASRLFGSWIVRSEIGALFSGDPELGNALLTTLGAERRVLGGTLIATLAVNLIAAPIADPLLFDRALLPMLIVAWSRDTGWGDVHLALTTGLERGDSLVEAKVLYRFDDQWGLTTGVDVPFGAADGPLGVLGDARRVRAALRFRR